MKNKKIFLLIACAALLISSVIANASAPASSTSTSAIDFLSTTNGSNTGGPWCLGFEFNVKNGPITVTDLGFYDDSANGLTQSHAVGIWNNIGTLLTSTTVSNADSLDGFFRYHAISPLVLGIGNGYTIGAVTGVENYTWDPSAFSVNPEIEYVRSRYVQSNVLTRPYQTTANIVGYFGPNFKIASSQQVVPEPSSIIAVGMPVLMIGLGKLRRLRK